MITVSSNSLRWIAALVSLLLPLASARGQLGGGFDLSWNTFDGGGGASSGGGFTLTGTIGQCDTGVMSGGAFQLSGGFWPGATGGPSCEADFNHDGNVNSQDFFDFLTAFFALGPGADFNGDGNVNSQDFFDFLTAFFAGC